MGSWLVRPCTHSVGWFVACEWLRQTPVMDLHQGSNEYNPLRSKPVTAAMKQDQKHIESSVYDPRTGKTVVSGEIDAPPCLVLCDYKSGFGIHPL